jgi:hypothetical protein
MCKYLISSLYILMQECLDLIRLGTKCFHGTQAVASKCLQEVKFDKKSKAGVKVRNRSNEDLGAQIARN